MAKGKIYKITNTINGKVYIGCTIYTLEKRFYEHLYRCFKTDYHSKLYNSIKKYGEENFVIELISECDLDKIYETEKKYIEQYDSFKNGLNSTLGGEGCLGYVHSPEIRRKISIKTKEGNSHKNKTYIDLYSNNSNTEKEKRKTGVKKYWDNLSEEDKEKRISRLKETTRLNSKYSLEMIIEIKTKIKLGMGLKDLKTTYPTLKDHLFYDLKNNRRWSDI